MFLTTELKPWLNLATFEGPVMTVVLTVITRLGGKIQRLENRLKFGSGL